MWALLALWAVLLFGGFVFGKQDATRAAHAHLDTHGLLADAGAGGLERLRV
jgi:hypothetical protein